MHDRTEHHHQLHRRDRGDALRQAGYREFGPLAYVFAQKLAGAELVATFSDEQGNPATYYATIVTTPDSGITDLSGIAGHLFAYSDPASTSGHLHPAFALKSSGIDPDGGVQAIYAGSHTAAFEALRNRKVDAGELNSDRIATATAAGEYSPAEWVTLWQSAPIPQDPITARGDLPPAFKNKIRGTLLSFDFRTLPPEVQQMFRSDVAMAGTHLVAEDDAAYDERPHASAAVQVRRWDEAAKDPAASTPSIEHFRPVLVRLWAQPPSSRTER